jgi:hypothetical protein
MRQVDGMKVIVLTRGDLTHTLGCFFSEPATYTVMYN